MAADFKFAHPQPVRRDIGRELNNPFLDAEEQRWIDNHGADFDLISLRLNPYGHGTYRETAAGVQAAIAVGLHLTSGVEDGRIGKKPVERKS